jgi:hypothetical protein
MTDLGVRQLIPRATTFWSRDHQAATPKARKVIRHDLARHPYFVRQIRWIPCTPPQTEQNPRSRRVRECISEPRQRVALGQHLHKSTIVQQNLYSTRPRTAPVTLAS